MNCHSTDYIKTFRFWFQDLLTNKSEAHTLDSLIKGKLGHSLFSILLEKVNEPAKIELLFLVQLLSPQTILKLGETTKNFEIVLKAVESDAENSKIYEQVLANFLLTCNFEVLQIYIKTLSKCKNSIMVIGLLEAFQRSFINKDFTEFIITKKLERALFECFFQCCSEESDLENWGVLLTCLTQLAGLRSLSFTDHKFLSFAPLVEKLKNNEKIIQRFVEELHEAVITAMVDKYYEIIRFPQIIPLFGELLCQNSDLFISSHEKILKSLKNSQISIDLLANHGLFSVIFYHLLRKKNFQLWKNCEILCMQLVSTNFSMYDLSQWLNVFLACNNIPMKCKILEILKTALNKSDTSDQISRYVYFTKENKVFFDSVCGSCNLGKEFGLMIWVFPESTEKCVLVGLKLPYDGIEVFTQNWTVTVKINESCVVIGEKLRKYSWNFIFVNFGYSISLFINGKMVATDVRKNYKVPKVNKLEKACVGNFFVYNKEKCGFVGKIASLLVMKKCFDADQVLDAYNVTASSAFSLSDQDSVQIRDLKDAVFVDLLEELFVCSANFSGIYKFHNIPIHKTLKCYGIRRFLFEIGKSVKDPETLNEFYSLAKTLIYKNRENSNSEYFTKDSMRFLAHLLTKSSYSEDICCTIQNILEVCSEENGKMLLNTVINTKELFNFLIKNKKFYRFVLKKMQMLFTLSKESLFVLCNTMKTAGFEDFSEDLTDYLNGVEEPEVFRCLPKVLFYFDHDQQYAIVHKMLIAVKILEIDVNYCKGMVGVLLNMQGNEHPGDLQKLSIDLLFLNKHYFSEPDFFKQYLEIVDNSLPQNLSFDLVQYFLLIGFDMNNTLNNFRYNFLDLILKRMRFVYDPSVFHLILHAFNENFEKLYESVVKRDIFPLFFEGFIDSSSEAYQMAQILIEVAAANEGFFYIQKFFSVFKDLNLFKTTLLKLQEKMSINEVLQSFEVLQDALLHSHRSLLAIFHLLESSTGLKAATQISLRQFSIEKLHSYPGSSSISKDLIVNFLNFLVFGLVFFRTQSEPFDFLDNFLSSPEILYFNQGELTNNTDLHLTETFLSLYFLSELLKNYLIHPQVLKDDLVHFINSTKILSKLSKFCEKHSKTLENFLRDILITESLEINRETIEAKVQVQQQAFKDCQEKLQNLFNISDLSPEPLNEIVKVFSSLFKKLTVSKNYFEKSNDLSPRVKKKGDDKDFIEKCLDEVRDTAWVEAMKVNNARTQWKIIQDYKFFKKNQKKMVQVLKNCEKTTKIRKVYDKLGRWSIFKSFSQKSAKKPFIPVALPIIHKESYIPSDGNSESPNISDNSAFTSRENTDTYHKSFQPQLYSTYIERIKVEGSYFGRLNLSPEFLELIFEGQSKDTDFPGALNFTILPAIKRRIWYPYEFSEVVLKRFIHKHTALEFILKSGKSYYLNFFTVAKKEEALRIIELWGLKSKIKISKKDLHSFANEWKKGAISNFEYLMLLNKYSSRSMNDLSQYPIFPWIISDYKRQKFDYEEDSNFLRNFKFPMGAQKPETHKGLQLKFETWSNDLLKPYHHGSHYSNAGIVLHYLVRIEPFMTQAKLLQGGSLDLPDRLFNSIDNAWCSCIENIGTDVKELIPELFFNALVLEGYTGSVLGVRSSGEHVKSVKPPVWATCNWDFIIKHKNLLESQVVSKELNNWIDLVFGFKQSGRLAESVFNVFCSASYENTYLEFCNSHEEFEVSSMTEQVYHFGQTPRALFRDKGHVVKEEGKVFTVYKFFYGNESGDLIFSPVEKGVGMFGRVNSVFFCGDFVLVVKNVNRMSYVCKFVVKSDLEIGNMVSEYVLQGYMPVDEGEFQYVNADFQHRTTKIEYVQQNFAVVSQKFLVAGLDITNNLKVFDFKGKLVQSLQFHTEFVLSVTNGVDFIFSGSFDSSIKMWKLEKECFASGFSLYGHSAPVFFMRFLETYQVLVSVAANFKVLLHDIKNAECLHCLNLEICSLDVNEHGIIGMTCGSSVYCCGVNGEKVSFYETEGKIDSFKLTFCGNFAIEAGLGKVIIRDIFRTDQFRVLEPSEKLNTRALIVHPSEKAIYCLSQVGVEIRVATFKLISQKQKNDRNEIILDLI